MWLIPKHVPPISKKGSKQFSLTNKGNSKFPIIDPIRPNIIVVEIVVVLKL